MQCSEAENKRLNLWNCEDKRCPRNDATLASNPFGSWSLADEKSTKVKLNGSVRQLRKASPMRFFGSLAKIRIQKDALRFPCATFARRRCSQEVCPGTRVHLPSKRRSGPLRGDRSS
jgi:hypothetical protein